MTTHWIGGVMLATFIVAFGIKTYQITGSLREWAALWGFVLFLTDWVIVGTTLLMR